MLFVRAWCFSPQLINDPDVEAVVICSPTDQHAGQIMAAAKAGKRIFCEKPISLSLEIIDEVIGGWGLSMRRV